MRHVYHAYKQRAHLALEAHFFDRPLGLLLVIGYKAVWGLAELYSGAFLLLYRENIIEGLIDDPQDLLANWVFLKLHAADINPVSIGSLIMGFGVIKIILAICMWFRFAIIREIGLVFFSLVGAYGVYHLSTHFSRVTFFALLLDMCALYYFWKILPKHLTKKMLYE